MRRRASLAAGAGALATLSSCGLLAGCASVPGARDDEAADGWAALEGGTPFAAGVAREHHIDIHTRADLDAALRLGATPKLLRIHGRIDLAAGRGAPAFADPAFDFDAYCRAYAPAAWGRRAPAGALEEARQRSSRAQAAAVVVTLPPHTTLVGATPDAGFIGGALMLEGTHHVVLRGLHLHGVMDHFPAWDPLDGTHGEWNSEYDAVALRRSHHVWVHHCRFESAFPARAQALGRLLQHNDGLLDITRASDLITVSWCRFSGHDKTMLIGGGDGHTEDIGRLRVSVHHNLWHRCTERTPRVRHGRVHVANNLYVLPEAATLGYAIGLGHRAHIACEANAFEASAGVDEARLVRVMARSVEGAQFGDTGSWFNGRPLDLGAVLRRTQPALAPLDPAHFTPPPVRGLVPAAEVSRLVRGRAGVPPA